MGGSGYGPNKYHEYYAHLHYEIHRNIGDGMKAVNSWQDGRLIDPQDWVSETDNNNLDAANEFLREIFSWFTRDIATLAASGLSARPSASLVGKFVSPKLRPGARVVSSLKPVGIGLFKANANFNNNLQRDRVKPFKEGMIRRKAQ